MSSVGEQLRRARELNGLSVEQVAETCKIKSDQIRALESGDFEVFAASVYVRGFARTLCRLYHLEERQIMMDLDLELSRSEKFNENASYSGPRKTILDTVMYWLSKIQWPIVGPILLIIAAIVGIVVGVRTYNENNRDPLSKLGSGMYQPPNQTSGDYLPLPTNAPTGKK